MKIGKVLVCLVLLVGYGAGNVCAEPISDGTSLRISAIEKALSEEATHSKIWQNGWTAVFGTLTLVETASAISSDEDDEKDDRHDSTVNAISSAIGTASMLLDPLRLHGDLKALELMPQETLEERQRKLKMAESYLEAAALREKAGRSLKNHLLSGLVNLAAGLAVTFDGGREDDGLAMFASGMLVSEIQIFSMPQKAVAQWEAYQEGNLDGLAGMGSKKPVNRFLVAASPGYVQFSVLF